MAQPMRIVSLEPTVFLAHHGDALRQLVRLSVQNDGPQQQASLQVRADGLEESLSLGPLNPGVTPCEAYLPDIRQPIPVHLSLWSAGALQDQTTLPWQPAKHWEVYLVHYSHHDLGYTDLPSHVLAEYDGFMDDVLRYCAETESWPEEDARFRYLCEQSWSVMHYLAHRPPEVVQRLMHFIRNGQIEVSALFGNEILELCGHEELIRLLYPAFQLQRAYGITLASAEHNDIPGFAWGLASVLAGAGIRYFSPGVPLWYFGQGADQVHPLWDTAAALPLATPAACWWEGPDGARVLLWSDLHGHEWQPYNLEQATHELPALLRDLDQHAYPYDMVSYTLRGGHRDNALPTLRYAHLVRAWNRRWAYPRLINATNQRFLGTFERRWGPTLKTLRGDVPGTDYPVAATCTPQETALSRHTHDALLTAEKLATIASVVAGYAYPRAALDEAYQQTFYYDEHCWGMAHPGGPAQDASCNQKTGFAYQAAALTHDLLTKASNRIADHIAYPDEAYYLTVFNPLAQARTDIVRAPLRAWQPCAAPMFLQAPRPEHPWPLLVSGGALGRQVVDPPPSLLAQPFALVDLATGQSLPYQLARLTDPQAAQPWAPERIALGAVDPRHLTELVFLAEDLPPLGFKTYQIVPCAQWPAFPPGPLATPTELENRFFKLQLDPSSGAVRSLLAKELGQDLLDPHAPHAFAQILVRACDTGAEEPLRITDACVADSGPVFTTLRLKGETACCPRVTVEFTFYQALNRVDLALRVLRDSTPLRELYLPFPFRVPHPQFRFEAPDAVIAPPRDQWPGSNTDYYAVQHWADVSNDRWGVVWAPLDTPMAEFGGLWPGYVSGAHHGVTPPGYGHAFLRPSDLRRAHIYALLSYNNFRTNFVNVHPGEFLARYALAAHPGDWRAGDAQAFGWAAANPPLPVWMHGPQEGNLPSCTSFCRTDRPNVLWLTLKRAEDADGYIVRLLETEAQEVEVELTLPFLNITQAFATNLVEQNQHPLPCTPHTVKARLRPSALATIRLTTE